MQYASPSFLSPHFHPSHQPLENVLQWLRLHIPAHAHLHADSRAIQPGDAFIAYPVNGADNRPYIDDAVKRGAKAVLLAPEGSIDIEGLSRCAAILPVQGLAGLAGPLASAWYGSPSDALFIVGMTGTNGKTSCSHWTAHALCALNTPCAIMGTLGEGLPDHLLSTGFTTPDAPQLQRSLAKFQRTGLKAVSMEVSSHALDQGRVNGVAFDVAVFTNLTQDHLDYHQTFAAYASAKARLFDWPTLRCAVINRDDPVGQRLIAHIAGRVRTIAYGICDSDTGEMSPSPAVSNSSNSRKLSALSTLYATAIRATAKGTAFKLFSDWGQVELEVPLLGRFNVSNLLAVLGALLAADHRWDEALAQLQRLKPVNGRMQWLGGLTPDEPLVVIDYAHTPDALEKTLYALQPVATNRNGALVCVFGCGGNRDVSKRPRMGAVAEQLADRVVLTSDNPRNELPAAIIDDIAQGISNPSQSQVQRIEDRARAILQAIREAAATDVILIAGRGHETMQDICGKKYPFYDQTHVQRALAARQRVGRCYKALQG